MKFCYTFLLALSFCFEAHATTICTTKIRSVCDGKSGCSKKIDRHNSIYYIEGTGKDLIIAKFINKNLTSKWSAQQIPESWGDHRSFLEIGGATTLLTIASSSGKFLLYFANSDETDAWAQLEMGECEGDLLR